MLDFLKPSREFSPLILICCALGTFLGFPNPFFHIPGLALALPVSLSIIASRAGSPGLAFKRGWMAGFLAYGAALYWLAYPIHYYGYLSWFVALPCPVLLGLYTGLYPGIFALLVRLGRDRLPLWAQALLAATAWAALEQARGFVGSGFPWLPLAVTLTPVPLAIQGAAVIGAYGLSGLLAGMCRLATERSTPARIGAAVIAAALLVYGGLALRNEPQVTKRVNVLAVQGNLDQSVKWSPEVREFTIERYMRLTDSGLAHGPADIVLWPETAMPFYFQEDNDLSMQVRDFVKARGLDLVTGAPGYVYDVDKMNYRFYNRAFHVGPDGAIDGYYDKRHLVPFGEYVPLGEYLPFVSKLVEGAGEFFPGDPDRKLNFGPFKIGSLICYEVIFPELAEHDAVAGANILVSISNDAWFGPTAAPTQHLDTALFRAVEQGRYLIRATNTGYSVVIDPKGRVLEKSSLFHTQALRFTNVGLISERTIFSRIFHPLNAAIWLIAIGLTAWAMFRRGRR